MECTHGVGSTTASSVNTFEVSQAEGGVKGSERVDPRSGPREWQQGRQHGNATDAACLATHAAWLYSDAVASDSAAERDGLPAGYQPTDDVVDVLHALEGVSSMEGIEHVTTSTVATKTHFRLSRATRDRARMTTTPGEDKRRRRMVLEQQQEDEDRLQLESLARQLQTHTQQLKRLKHTLGLLETVDDATAGAELSAIDRELMQIAGLIDAPKAGRSMVSTCASTNEPAERNGRGIL